MAIKMAVSESEFESLSLEHVQDSCYLFTGFLESTDIIKLYGLNRKMLEWNYLFRTHRKGIVDFFVHNRELLLFGFVTLEDCEYDLEWSL